MTDQPISPVVAVDVDGVLRVPNAKAGREYREGIVTAEISMRSDAYPRRFHAIPSWDEGDPWTATHSFSGIGANWMRGLLSRGVDVVWASTWVEHANTYFAPALGLPPLPVAVVDDGEPDRTPAEWKIRQLSSNALWRGRPLLWVDDLPAIRRPVQLDQARRPVDRALTMSFIVPDTTRGLSTGDIQSLDDWVDLASTVDGQQELRRRRQQRLRRVRDRNRQYQWGSEAAYRRWRKYELALRKALPPDSLLSGMLAGHLAEERDDIDVAHVRYLLDEWGGTWEPSLDELLQILESLRSQGGDAPAQP